MRQRFAPMASVVLNVGSQHTNNMAKLGWNRNQQRPEMRLEIILANEEGLRYRIRLWNMYYNDLEHCGLDGKTPNEFLADYQLTDPPNVPA